MHGTTILAVRKGAHVVLAGDGQVSLGNTVMKRGARKVRRLQVGPKGDREVLVGFAGSTADAFTLVERFEAKLKSYGGHLRRAAVELAKDWRTDKLLRKLEAMIIAADARETLVLSGSGDVIEPDEGVAAVGSGGMFATAAALALVRNAPDLDAETIARASMRIAGDICIYTNDAVTVERLEVEGAAGEGGA